MQRKKTAAQLDREIAEALSPSRAHSSARAMPPEAAKIVHRLVELDTEYGWRPESQQEVRRKIEEWRDEAVSAIAAGVRDPWFRDIEAALAALGPQAEIVYRRRVDELGAHQEE